MSVVIYYQSDVGEEAHYPPEGSVAADERGVIINGKFNVKATYKVWLKVFERRLTVSFQQTKPLDSAVRIGTVYHLVFFVIVIRSSNMFYQLLSDLLIYVYRLFALFFSGLYVLSILSYEEHC